MAPTLSFGNDRLMYQRALDLGYNPGAAAGMVGNAGAESGFGTNMFNPAGGGQGAFGGFQWRGDRQTKFRKFAEDNGLDVNDPLTSIDFADWELRNDHAAAGTTFDEFNKITDPLEASKFFRDKFERPGGHGYEAALRHAGNTYNSYSGLDPIDLASFRPEGDPGANLRFAGDADSKSEAALQAFLNERGTDKLYNEIYKGLVPGYFNQDAFASPEVSEGPASRPSAPGGNTQAQPTIGYEQTGQAAPPPQDAPAEQKAPAPRPGAAVSREVTPDDEKELATRPTLLERLFPTSGDEAADTPVRDRESLGRGLTALGVGLSQMSHGAPIDVSTPINHMRALQQQRIRDKSAEAQRQIDNQTAAYNAQTSRMNAELGQRSHDLALAEFDQKVLEFNAKSAAPPISMQMMQPYIEQNPRLEPLVRAAVGGSEDAAKELYQYLGDNVPVKPTISAAARDVAVLANSNAPEGVWRSMMASLEPHEVDFIKDIIPTDRPTSSIQEAEWAAGQQAIVDSPTATEPEKYIARQQLTAYENSQSRRGGLDPNQRQLDQQAVAMYDKARDWAINQSTNASNMSPLITDTLASTIAINKAGGETGNLSGLINSGMSALGSIGADAAKSELGKFFNIPAETLNQLNDDGLAFMYGLKNEYGVSGASFSDNDAKMLAQISPSEVQTGEGRARLLSRLQASNVIGQAQADYITDSATSYDTIRARESVAKVEMPRYKQELSRVLQQATLEQMTGTAEGKGKTTPALRREQIRHYNSLPAEERPAYLQSIGMTKSNMSQYVQNSAAKMPLDIAKLFAPHMPELQFINDNGTYYKRQPDGSWKKL